MTTSRDMAGHFFCKIIFRRKKIKWPLPKPHFPCIIQAVIMTVELKNALNKIIKNYNPEKIILFGSRARDEERSDSDYDFIIIKNTKARWIRRALKIPDVPIRADFFVYTPKEFEQMKESGNIFMREALKNHKILYEK